MSDFIDLDFTGVDRGPKLIPEGDHVLTVVGFEKKKPKTPLNAKGEKKYDSIHVTFEDAEGSKVRSFFNLHPNSIWGLRLFLEAVSGEELDGPLQINPNDYIGAAVLCTVVHEPRSDNAQLMQNRITAYQYVG